MTTDFHSDDIADVFGNPDALADAISRAGPCDNLDEKLPSPRPVHTEPCPKCRGSGRYSGYSTRGQHCFKCKGTGRLTFKSSSEQRAKARAAGARRKAERAERDAARARVEAELWMEEHRAEGLWIEAKRDSFDFARNMWDALHRWGGLTEGQLSAVQRCVARDAERAARDAERQVKRAELDRTAPRLDVTRIEKAFDVACERAHRAGQMGTFVKPLRLTSSEATGGFSVRFWPGTPGTQWEGMLFAKTEDGKKLGHIKGGTFVRKFDCTEAETAAVIDCASDPEKSVMAYAKAWSKCGICGRGLLNDVSIERGIGPICASRFGFFGS